MPSPAISPEILAGQAAADRRRVELARAFGYSQETKTKKIFDWLPDPETTEKKSIRVDCGINTAVVVQPHPDNLPATQSTKAQPAIVATKAQPASLQPVKLWPLLGITAARSEAGGAWRAWTLAKHLDDTGKGWILSEDLQDLARALGIHPKTWRRWISAARGYGLLIDVQNKTGDWRFILASQATAAQALGCDHIGTRAASITAGDLAGEGWRAFIWAAYEQTHRGRPISRAKQLEITGVPISTQRAYDNQAGVERRANYAISNRAADNLPGVIEFENRPAPFKFWDKQGRRWVIAWRLPDSRTANTAESLGRGRSKKINRLIRTKQLNGLSYSGQPLSFDVSDLPAWRLFHRTNNQVKASERKLTRADLQPNELYLYRHDSPTNSFWDCLPQGGLITC